MPDIHRFLGVVVVALFGLIAVWGWLFVALRRDPGRFFWWPVAAVQVLIGLQIVAGFVLLILGYPLPKLLHMGYGLFAAGALVWAHVEARQHPERPWVAFAWVGLIAFGLTLRALQTGMGAA
jgi:heme A synthase